MKAKVAALAIVGLAAIGFPYSALPAQQSSSGSRSVWDGVYTEQQADDGHQLYGQQCASCHGNQLEGGEQAPPLAGGDFLSDWNGLTVGDLFERTRKTMPQNKPDSLGHEVIANILAYILSVNRFPAGKTDLPHDAELLRGIRIEATKPEQGNKK